jgi:tetratricopeptide (TPR) repeat protein
MQARFYAGDLPATETYFALWRKHYDVAISGLMREGAMVVVATAAFCAHLMGHTDLARLRIAESEALALATKDFFSLMICKWLEARFHWELQDPERVIAAASQAVAICEENHFPLPLGIRSQHAWALARLGKIEEAVSLTQNDTTSAAAGLVSAAVLQADVRMMAGMYDIAMELVERSMSASQDQTIKPEILKIRGETRIKLGQLDAAETDFRESIERSRKMGAKILELRATTSLARALRDTNRRGEARAMLGDIYNWFTEDFDTADLKDAKALLGEFREQMATGKNIRCI